MKKIILLIQFISSIAYSQFHEISVFGTVSDSTGNSEISYANIKIAGAIHGTTTDVKGNFYLEIEKLPATLIVSHDGYQNFYLNISEKTKFPVHIKLKSKITELTGVNVTAGKVEKILEKRPYDVWDYEIYEDKLLLLCFDITTRLVLSDFNGDTVCSVKVTKPEMLYKDCLGNVHLLTKDSAYQIFYDSKQIILLYASEIYSFIKTMKNCVFELNGKLYFKEYSRYEQQLNYYYFDETYNKPDNFRTILNTHNLSIINSLKYIPNEKCKYIDEVLFFQKQFFEDSVYCPLIKLKDSIYLFNFIEHRIECYDSDGRPIENKFIDIDFHKKDIRKKTILTDDASGKAYLWNIKQSISTINRIDIKTGKLKETIKIPGYTQLDKIRIYDNNLFFMYRDISNVYHINYGYKKVYKMKIPG
ncbi:MAG: hypothetical protein A2309_12475 [Bacteroidetes bacterium RIFOXYB2_FULL_35_7]|nr:MAG: hypothetical protein A2309_12475 [Bacteroidetes bacterium RIFOXYB2_FULL_35_7]